MAPTMNVQAKREALKQVRAGRRGGEVVRVVLGGANGPHPRPPQQALLRSQGRTAALAGAAAATAASPKVKVAPRKSKGKAPATATTPTQQPHHSAEGETGPLSTLQRTMARKLAGAEFRWLNEKLYTTPSQESFSLFQSRPDMFHAYHVGFRSQVEAWPANPVDGFIRLLRTYPTTTRVADLGCGDGKLGTELADHLTVHSFDLVSPHPGVVACDIAALPLTPGSVDVVVFCLSLMGTNFLDFLREAHRILRAGGELHIAEVISRFPDVEAFTAALCALGFQLCGGVDRSNKMFVRFHLRKLGEVDGAGPRKRSSKVAKGKTKATPTTPTSSPRPLDTSSSALLRPCVYKKR
jgi:SAM-dependent methyltransferase